MDKLIQQLRKFRASARSLLLQSQLALIVVGVIAFIIIVGLLDFALRLPDAFRFVLLIGGLALLAWALVRGVWPAIRFRPSLVEMALQVERRHSSVQGRLASAVDLAMSQADAESPLAQRSIADAESRAASVSFKNLLDARNARWLLAAAACTVLVGVFIVVSQPADASIATQRVLLPFGSAHWPARTALASQLDTDLVHPRGEPLVFAADLVKGSPESERVFVRYRSIDEENVGAWQTLQMTRQSGSRFERVVDTYADRIEYSFSSTDSETPLNEVLILPAPAVIASTGTIQPPEYAEIRGSLSADLGTGTDRRARFEAPILIGSEAQVVLELNRPLPVPEEGRLAWLEDTIVLPGEVSSDEVTFEIDEENPTQWHIAFPVRGTGDLLVNLEDEYGLVNLDPIRYRFNTVEDYSPTVTISQPASDEAVSQRAVIPVVAEARDDVQLERLLVEATLQKGGQDSRVETLASRMGADQQLTSAESVSFEFALEELEVESGDEVVLVAIAADAFEFDGEKHEHVRSAPRKLKIVGDAVVAEELRAGLASIRRSAMRMESEQADIEDVLNERGADESMRQSQARLGNRIASTSDALESLAQRRDRNRLEDAMLNDVLQQSGDLLDAANRASTQATEAIEKANDASDLNERTESERDAREAQETVRAELTDLADLLDRDEDAWVVTRRVQQMRERLENLMARTEELAEETVGRERSELSEAQRDAIDRLSSEQADEREEAQDLVEELQERASAIDRVDPAQAEGLREAAQRAQEGRLEQNMEEASEASRNNRLQQANEAQQQAAEALEQMLEEIEESRKSRAEEIRRRIASLIESLKGLIEDSENELIALARIGEDPDQVEISQRSREMMRINTNTLAVAANARAAGNEGARIARFIDRASRSQSAAITDLRSQPPGLADARDEEERALASLKEALVVANEQAERLAEQQAEEKRRALMAAYEEVLSKEIDIKKETEETRPKEGERLGRRGLMAARRIGVDQGRISQRLNEIKEEFQEITDSMVFSMTHRNLDAWSSQVAERLKMGTIDDDVIERESMIIDSLAGMLEALAEDRGEDDPFEEQENQGNGGGGQGQGMPQPLIPPIAELKALRSLQKQVLEATRRLDKARPLLSEDAFAGRVDELAEMQGDLHAVGEALLQQLQMEGPQSQPRNEELPEPTKPGGDDT